MFKSKKDRQHNGQRKKDKQWSTKYTNKPKDRVTRTPLKTGVNSVQSVLHGTEILRGHIWTDCYKVIQVPFNFILIQFH